MDGPPLPASGAAPRVVTLFKVYAVLLGIVYLAAGALLITVLLAGQPTSANLPSGIRLTRLLLVAVCTVLSLVFLAVPFLPRKPWVWVYGLVSIVLGLTSIVVIPFSLPLLLFWLKPGTKSYYQAVGPVL
jgi:hypothetical protein